MKIFLKNVRAVDPLARINGTTDILIENGTITRIAEELPKELAEGAELIDCTGLCAIPGLFDMHVHWRDPGLTEKEDIFTGAAAAKEFLWKTKAKKPSSSPGAATGSAPPLRGRCSP